jgi:hypothetical protein
MNPEAEQAAKGRIISDYTVTKARLAMLKGQAHQIISQLQRLADQINNYETASPDYDVSFLSNINYKVLITDLQITTKSLANLQQEVKNLGVDLKT